MDRRDKTLLDKQLWGVNPYPPSLSGLALVAVFLGGIVIGSVLFAREVKHSRTLSHDITGTVRLSESAAED
jgi:hypothetical protein